MKPMNISEKSFLPEIIILHNLGLLITLID
jgi:hypothetical protein